MTILIIVLSVTIIMLLFLSFLSSFSEMSIASLNKSRLLVKRNKNNNKKIKKIIDIYENPNQTITSIVIFNNVVNILATVFSTLLFTELTNTVSGPLISFAVMTFSMIVFAEIMPKVLARKDPEKASILIINWVFFLNKALHPFTFIFSKFSKNKKKAMLDSTKEIKIALEESKKYNVTTKYESLILSNALKFSSIKVKNIMQVLDIGQDTISIDISQKNLFKFLKNSKSRRIPVVENKKPVGYINSYEILKSALFEEGKEIDLSSFIYKTSKFEETTTLNEALSILQSKRKKIAFVVNKKNELLGLITIENILEEIIGDINDETDIVKDGVYLSNKNSVVVDGSVKMSFILKKYLKQKEKKWKTNSKETILQWAIKQNGKKQLPEKGSFTFLNWIIWFEYDEKKKEYRFEIELAKN